MSDKTASDLFIKLDQEKWNDVENDILKVIIKVIGIIVPLFTNWEKQSEKKAESFDKIEVGATKIEA